MIKQTNSKTRAIASMIGSAVVLGTLATSHAHAQNIAVVINDRPVTFQGSPPQEMNGSVLVPLRGVFEQLGANVMYNALTRTIEATKGTTDVILRLGEATAYINNTPQTLAQAPVVMGGTTLVPLRFVAQAFGASVKWDGAAHTVLIRTADAGPVEPAAPTAVGDFAGQVAGVVTNTVPQQLLVMVNGQKVSIPVNSNTIVLLQRGKESAVETTIDRLLPGDTVQISRPTAGGAASTIRSTYQVIEGQVKTVGRLVSGSHIVTVAHRSGEDSTVEIAPNAPVTVNGQQISWSAIHANDAIEIRIDPQSQLGYSVSVVPSIPVAVTPAVPNPNPDKAITINAIRVDTAGPLKGGDALRVSIRGTDGVKAAFSVPGIVDAVPMTETAPGFYQGSYVIPAGVNINGGAVIGRLANRSGNQPVLIQAGQNVTIDSRPPVIGNELPSESGEVSNGRPRVSATLDDGAGSGIDSNASKVFVDGRDVSGDTIITPHFVTYQPTTVLSDGQHRVRLAIADAVGNVSVADWTFVVNASKGLVTSLESNLTPSSNHLSAGHPLHVTMKAQPGGSAYYSIGGVASRVEMKETSPGVYSGDYIPGVGATTKNAPIDAKFVSKSGAVVSTPLDVTINIDAGLPMKPTITAPKPDDAVPGHVMIMGKAAPNATIQVDVSFRTPLVLGLATNGKAASTQVIADQTGRWKTDDLKLSAGGLFGSAKGTTYTVTAMAVDATGQQSAADSVDFRQQ